MDPSRAHLNTTDVELLSKWFSNEFRLALEYRHQAHSVSDAFKSFIAAYYVRCPERVIRALAGFGNRYLAGEPLQKFWSVGSFELENYQRLIPALNDLAAAVEALCSRLSAVIEFVSESPDNSTKVKVMLEVSCAAFRQDCCDRIAESTAGEGQPTFIECLAGVFNAVIAAMEDQLANEQSVSVQIEIVQAVMEPLRKMHMWRTVNKLGADAVRYYLKGRIDAMLEENSGQGVLQELLDCTEHAPLQFLRALRDPKVQEDEEQALSRWRSEMHEYIYTTLLDLRVNSLFDLVIDYPESEPALYDLKGCLRSTKDYRSLVAVFGSAIRRRLLHPGAATGDIIHHYVSTIRALRHIDQSGTILDLVTGPLKGYLCTRTDAIRCIVTMITEDDGDGDGPGFLAELEEEGEGYDPELDYFGLDADKLALQEIEGDLWQPPPFIVPGQPHNRRTVAPGDVVSMLVNIYGSKELFVTEYRSMLADKLLAKTDFDCDRELRTQELLKVRFGEQPLHSAEVMLRDLADSKRINSNVRAMDNAATPLKACKDPMVPLESFGVTIVSDLFWPQAPTEEFSLPQSVQGMMRTFGHKYHALKAPRVLKWKPSLGTVNLTLTIGDKDVEYNVSPIQATILLKFEQQSEWEALDLLEALQISPESFRRKILFWLNQGVIVEMRDEGGAVRYRRNEVLERPVGGAAGDDHGMDLEDGAGAPEVDAMAQFEPFVLGMLTNFDSMPLERIHNMLKMFVTDPPYDRTIEQLSAFMGKLSTEDKVFLDGGAYKRRR